MRVEDVSPYVHRVQLSQRGRTRSTLVYLHGFDKSAPQKVYRQLVETGGQVEVPSDRLVVGLDKRSPNPLLGEAEWDKGGPAIPWLGDRRVTFAYP